MFITPVIIATESVKSKENNIVLLCTEKQVGKSQDLAVKQSDSTFFGAPTPLTHVGSMNTVVLTRGNCCKSGAVHDDGNIEEEGWSKAREEPDSTTMMADRTEKHAKTCLIDLTVAVPTLGLINRNTRFHALGYTCVMLFVVDRSQLCRHVDQGPMLRIGRCFGCRLYELYRACVLTVFPVARVCAVRLSHVFNTLSLFNPPDPY